MIRNLFLVLITTILTLTSCGKSKANAEHLADNNTKKGIEVLYFHSKQRCVTCNAIENLTKELLESDFADQLKNGEIVFKVIDISTLKGERIADQYEVTWSSLYINQWADGKETRNNMTDFGFTHAKNSPEIFKEGVKKKIYELLM